MADELKSPSLEKEILLGLASFLRSNGVKCRFIVAKDGSTGDDDEYLRAADKDWVIFVNLERGWLQHYRYGATANFPFDDPEVFGKLLVHIRKKL